MKTILGYKRENGAWGIQNNLLIMSSVSCANDTVKEIAKRLPGAICLTHQHGCGHLLKEDIDQTRRVLVNSACNPNIAACIVVGLGCELLESGEIADDIRLNSHKRTENVCIQQCGGTEKAIKRGVIIGADILNEINKIQKTECRIENITIGITGNCRGRRNNYDCNSFLGDIAKSIIELGANVIMAETPLMYLCKEECLKKCASTSVRNALTESFLSIEKKLKNSGAILTSELIQQRGNAACATSDKRHDLTKDYIKRLRGLVINESIKYGELPKNRKLIHMDSNLFIPEILSGMCASGAQLLYHAVPQTNSRFFSPITPLLFPSLVDGKYIVENEINRILSVALSIELQKEDRGRDSTFAITRIGPST